MVKPILLDFPSVIVTRNLLLRPPKPGDGKLMYQAVKETRAQLARWMPWAQGRVSEAALEEYARRSCAQWTLREELPLVIFDRTGKRMLGATGMHRINWQVPSFELGYWLRKSAQGKGYAQEATLTLAHFCFDYLAARRIEIRCDDQNRKSMKVPLALGFIKEACLAQDALAADGNRRYLRNTLVFAITKKTQIAPTTYRVKTK